jgi:hypothetical protein
MPETNRQWVYLLLAIAGISSTWYFNIHFMMENGTDIRDFIKAVTLNDAAMSIAYDISIIGIAFLFWSYHEAKKLAIKHWWLYPVLSCGVAIAFAGPLFLYMRERKLQALNKPG